MNFLKYYVFLNEDEKYYLKDKISQEFKLYDGNANDKGILSSKDRLMLVYEAPNTENINDFLNENLHKISKHKNEITMYVDKVDHFLELVIYVDEVTSHFNININQSNLNLLSKLNIDFSITFIDF